jgi:hypothetical protein
MVFERNNRKGVNMADKMLIDGLIKFCDEKSKNIKLKAEPQVFVEIAESLKLLKWYQQGMEDIPDESGVLPKDVYRAGYIKAIDEFVEKAYFILGCEDSDIYCKETIKEIAEQLKAGGIDG